MLKETNHDYQCCIVGNFYDNNCNGEYSSWSEFKTNYLGFDNSESGFDDRYHYVFRYDIHKQRDEYYCLELCVMLQRKGIYSNLRICNVDIETLNSEVKEWLKCRYKYIKNLWSEVLD